MTNAERVLEYLSAIAPRSATNADIWRALGLPWRASAYQATRALAERGLVTAERDGRAWRFCATPTEAEPARETSAQPAPEEPPLLDEYSWDICRSATSYQVRWLAPLLAQPEGCAWFLRRLNIACPLQQARTAQVWHGVYPLRDLFLADYARWRESKAPLDGLFGAYNRLFGLPEDFGLARVWRTARGELRAPWLRGKGGWTSALLAKQSSSGAQARKARWVRRLFRAPVDALIATEHCLVLVLCARGRAAGSRRIKRARRLAGLLERRLGKTFSLAAVVDQDQQLQEAHLPFVLWQDVREYLDQEQT